MQRDPLPFAVSLCLELTAAPGGCELLELDRVSVAVCTFVANFELMVQQCLAADLSPYVLFVAERVSLVLFSLNLGEPARDFVANKPEAPC